MLNIMVDITGNFLLITCHFVRKRYLLHVILCENAIHYVSFCAAKLKNLLKFKAISDILLARGGFYAKTEDIR